VSGRRTIFYLFANGQEGLDLAFPVRITIVRCRSASGHPRGQMRQT
jgi:hypothetical protein